MRIIYIYSLQMRVLLRVQCFAKYPAGPVDHRSARIIAGCFNA